MGLFTLLYYIYFIFTAIVADVFDTQGNKRKGICDLIS